MIYTMSGRVTDSISLPVDMHNKLHLFCEMNKCTRSSVVHKALRMYFLKEYKDEAELYVSNLPAHQIEFLKKAIEKKNTV